MFYLSLICVLIVIFHVGYITKPSLLVISEQLVVAMFYVMFTVESLHTLLTILSNKKLTSRNYAGIAIFAYFIIILLQRVAHLPILSFLENEEWIYFGITFIFFVQLSKNSLFFDNFYFNPTILFVISFLGLIIFGALLLMLPKTTLEAPLSFIDAFFMATSAVCITGLAVTDISTNFSLFGQTVIMLLIQIGGLGIMTFTGFFGYFFSGGFSFKNQLMFGEILGENKLNSVISTLLTIIFITLLFEFIGGVFIFFSLDSTLFDSFGDQLFFAAFHAISSFCNAGFTILKDGIQSENYRFNYSFQIALAMIFIFGGLGFGTVYNFYTYTKAKISTLVCRLFLKKTYKYKPQMFSFNAKFILLCNVIVIVLATISYYFFEQQHTLTEDKSVLGEWATSFFMANTSRSAGFNSVNVSFLANPTLIMVVTLMWIGASPGSTGGGVKVTTVALAFLNIIALARGKESIEIYKRRIANESINKAFAIILLSVVSIAASFILLNFSDPNIGMIELLFEAISAYTTCGLSLGITGSLSSASKIILMFTMFIGRVGTLTLLVAFIKNTNNKSYIYPTEKILF